MSTLITAAVLLALGLWVLASYGRMTRLRQQVTGRWREVHALRKRQQELTPEPGASPPDAEALNEATRALRHAERIYNLAAAKYNAAIAALPGNLLAGVAGFKRAELIESARS
jgi:hypothetical protein